MSDKPCAGQWTNIPKGDCGGWSNAARPDGCDDWKLEEDWILVTAFWQDIEHYWRDVAFWRDEITNWVTA